MLTDLRMAQEELLHSLLQTWIEKNYDIMKNEGESVTLETTLYFEGFDDNDHPLLGISTEEKICLIH